MSVFQGFPSKKRTSLIEKHIRKPRVLSPVRSLRALKGSHF